MYLQPLAALSDNYIWLLHDGSNALIVDPGQAEPVLHAVSERHLRVQAVLVTHHHGDHTAGLPALQQTLAVQAFGPADEAIAALDVRVRAGDRVQALGLDWQVLAVPGHTAGHIAFFHPSVPLQTGTAPVLFCGDTLFAAGCGRIFEGTAAQMLASLEGLATLPDATLVCCGHEYTVSNLRFAAAVEPDNVAVSQARARALALRADGLPTVPTTLADERAVNPFLRSRLPGVRRAVAQWLGHAPADDAGWFAALREWKNVF
ncbi:hydroxyacylglutathione hydrolase [Lampropedia cohaerens]|uniref:Hydroxyacylglutathione hydrolase n=1 Tax=Lampropedia cohaerens TaxID=1610491 RepID=A0A0U1PZS5_9BURK|nr:hydroxyacylglutathione hydrolase [Lampropedia cohaerens]KKW68014.1 hydroxyacylglutathione hydrolase [Lampropedia cohaerens]